jgi:selenocysteine lyase/cysteine desulfurase
MLTRVVHLSSCTIGARSAALDTALGRMLETMGAGPAAWSEFEQEAHGARRRFAALIGADPDQVAIVPNASVGASGGLHPVRLPGPVITTTEEFPRSHTSGWPSASRRAGGPRTPMPGQDAGRYRAAVDERTVLVSVPLVTYRTAGLPDPRWPLAHARGARYSSTHTRPSGCSR